MNENKLENVELYPKMFTWLSIGLLITFVVGYVLSLNTTMMLKTLTTLMWPIIIAELVIALVMGLAIKKLPTSAMAVLYVIFCITTGLTFSTIFVVYKMSSIIFIFAVTAGIFALLALYGYKTKKDLSKMGIILFFGLIGILVIALLNIFVFKSTMLSLGLSIVCMLVFIFYIAYDMQMVKRYADNFGIEKAAIYGAFQLYLDFINLFIRLLELFGKRND
jgi:uncharacterized protein